MTIGLRDVDLVAVLVGHAGHGDRRAGHAVRAQGGIDVGHGQRGRLHGANGHRGVKRVARIHVHGGRRCIVVSEGGGRVGDRAQPDLRGHRRLRGVMRANQALQRSLRAHGATAGVLDFPVGIGKGIVVAAEAAQRVRRGCAQAFVDRTALLHPGHHVDRLPGGADLHAPAAAVDLIDHVVHRGLGLVAGRRVGGVIRTVDAETEHLAGAGLDGRDHDLHAGGVGGRDRVVRRLHGRVVGVHIHGGVDVQTALVQQLLAVRLGFAELLGIEDLGGHVRAEERRVAGRLAALIHRLNIERIHQRDVHRLVILGLLDQALVQHEPEHDVALILRVLLVLGDRRVQARGVLGDGGDGGRLHQVQILGMHVEVPLRRGLHTIQIVGTELGDVQIPLQDLRLGVHLLHLHGDQHLA